MEKKRAKDLVKRLNSLSLIIENSKNSNSLFVMNEYLRRLVMGHYGDTCHDIDEILKQHQENSKWRKKGQRKSYNE